MFQQVGEDMEYDIGLPGQTTKERKCVREEEIPWRPAGRESVHRVIGWSSV